MGKSNERILCKLSNGEILRLHLIVYVAMETTKTSNFTCQSNSFISIFFTCQVSACELQPFSCHNLANDLYSETAKTVFSHLKDIKGSSLPFGGVSIVAIGDLFQLQPLMDGYIFKNMDNDEYGVLAPNVWQDLFKMFELKQIMRQRESKDFAELLNRLREENHTKQDIQKLKQRIISITNHEYPKDAPHVFIQNAKVNDLNARAHNALPTQR